MRDNVLGAKPSLKLFSWLLYHSLPHEVVDLHALVIDKDLGAIITSQFGVNIFDHLLLKFDDFFFLVSLVPKLNLLAFVLQTSKFE